MDTSCLAINREALLSVKARPVAAQYHDVGVRAVGLTQHDAERLGTPEDIAAAVAFLAGPDGAWINGQTLRANGGMV
jgi:NAD(P)-dependent dehydrogenase (short-subunit alcohol dehydrogenase family)